MYQDKDAEHLRRVFAQFTAEQAMMTELERYKGEQLWRAEYDRVTPAIEQRARKAIAAGVAEIKNADARLAEQRRKAAQRTSESPRLQNTLALARADFDAAETPEDLAKRIEQVRA